MSFTYDELKQAIQDYTENTETTFVNNLDIFIKNAEERILKIAQLEVFRKNQSGALTASNQYLALPSDYLAPFSLSITNGSSKDFILFKDVNFVQSFNPNAATTGVPRYYAQFDIDNFILGPTPDDSYVVELHYFYYPPSIVTAGTSWLGDNFDPPLLYGSLIEAHTFMKGEPDVIAQYEKQYNDAMAMLKQLSEGKNRQDMYRTPQARYQVQ